MKGKVGGGESRPTLHGRIMDILEQYKTGSTVSWYNNITVRITKINVSTNKV